ncbi:sulfatase [Pontiella agarivorans]|uniref:Sulfatase n=1 Tax=Pontiella agarivorans TaxID=3038953 RepID=A0ABU5MX32_9BACT|nr:sulfatase [Pontiella agarivorans]MDZ8118776.1 sulfatase [Pontiella agarivorans]
MMRSVAGKMIPLLRIFFFGALSVAAQVHKPNVLLLCVDDLRMDGDSIGMSFAITPNMDRLAAQGRTFNRHFANAPTCGASRYTMLTGRYGATGNHALWARSKKMAKGDEVVPPSMPEWFRINGYTAVSIGKVSHTPGGLGGKEFNDPNIIEMPRAWDEVIMPVGPWLTPKGAMHGLAHGATHKLVKGSLHVFEAVEGPDDIYHDGLITDDALQKLDDLASDSEKPFFLAVGLIKPHLPFGAPKKYLDLYEGVELPPIAHPEKPEGLSTWYESDEFMRYDRWDRDPRTDPDFADDVRRHYAACVSYADAQIGRLVAKLKETGADKNTVIVVWGDHGWNLGEHHIWGKHNLFDEGLHSPLIVVSPEVKEPGKPSNAIVETLDLFPTVCELAGLEIPGFVEGASLVPQLMDPDIKGRSAIAYWREVQSIRTKRYRLVLHPDGQKELYDHHSAEKETRNVVSQYPEVAVDLEKKLKTRLPERRWW